MKVGAINLRIHDSLAFTKRSISSQKRQLNIKCKYVHTIDGGFI